MDINSEVTGCRWEMGFVKGGQLVRSERPEEIASLGLCVTVFSGGRVLRWEREKTTPTTMESGGESGGLSSREMFLRERRFVFACESV